MASSYRAFPSSRTTVLAWTKVGGRQRELAALVGGRACVIYPSTGSKLIRYVRSAWSTWRHVRPMRRGDICVVTAPPVFAPAVAILAARPGVAMVVDSHPGAFGLMGDRLSALLGPLQAWSLRRAALVLVTTDTLVDRVRAVGGNAIVFHEPDHCDWAERKPASGSGVLFPGTFQRDEPISVVLAAARLVPEVEFRLTGDKAQAPAGDLGPNVHLTGWLTEKDFAEEVSNAATVLVLTTEPESVMRTAYEAIRDRRPLIVTRTPATEKYFPHAWHVRNDPADVAHAVNEIQFAPLDVISDQTAAALAAERLRTSAQTESLMFALRRISTFDGLGLGSMTAIDLIGRKAKRALRRIGRIRPARTADANIMSVSRDEWEKDAQTGEFDFHRKDRWRQTDDFVGQSDRLFRHFGFEPRQFVGKTVVDLGAGSKLRTKFFQGSRLLVIEPLADRFLAEIDWTDLRDAAAVHSVPAEQCVESLVGEVDLLVSVNVLDHCYDFGQIVDNIRNYLKPDGLAFVSFDKHAVADEMHPLSLTEESSTRMFTDRGLVVEKMTTGMGDALGGAQTYGHGPYTLNYWLRTR